MKRGWKLCWWGAVPVFGSFFLFFLYNTVFCVLRGSVYHAFGSGAHVVGTGVVVYDMPPILPNVVHIVLLPPTFHLLGSNLHLVPFRLVLLRRIVGPKFPIAAWGRPCRVIFLLMHVVSDSTSRGAQYLPGRFVRGFPQYPIRGAIFPVVFHGSYRGHSYQVLARVVQVVLRGSLFLYRFYWYLFVMG